MCCGSLRNWRLWIVTTCSRRTFPSSWPFHTTRSPSRFQRPSKILIATFGPIKSARSSANARPTGPPPVTVTRRTVAGSTRATGGRCFSDLRGLRVGRGALLGLLEAEQLVADLDLITGPEVGARDGLAVHPGPVAATAVGEHVAVGLLPELGVQPGGRRVAQDDVVLLTTAERDRRAADREALASQAALQPHDRCLHRAISHPHVRIPARPHTSHHDSVLPTRLQDRVMSLLLCRNAGGRYT